MRIPISPAGSQITGLPPPPDMTVPIIPSQMPELPPPPDMTDQVMPDDVLSEPPERVIQHTSTDPNLGYHNHCLWSAVVQQSSSNTRTVSLMFTRMHPGNNRQLDGVLIVDTTQDAAMCSPLSDTMGRISVFSDQHATIRFWYQALHSRLSGHLDLTCSGGEWRELTDDEVRQQELLHRAGSSTKDIHWRQPPDDHHPIVASVTYSLLPGPDTDLNLSNRSQ